MLGAEALLLADACGGSQAWLRRLGSSRAPRQVCCLKNWTKACGCFCHTHSIVSQLRRVQFVEVLLLSVEEQQ